MIDDSNFANLFRQTPEMVCILSGPEHRFEFVNQAHIRALGFDATGQAVREAQPESVEVHGILDEVYRTGVTAELREIAVTLTDRTRYFNLTYAARRNTVGTIDGIMILGSEVTEQVLAHQAKDQHIAIQERAQDRIQRSEDQLRALADSMPQVVWTARPDGTLDYTNQRWVDYSGSSDPARWLDFVFPNERSKVVASWSASVASGSPYEAEFRLLRASDGTYRWHLVRAEPAFDEAGRVTRWFGTCTDIDDQKRSEDLFRFLSDVSVVLSRATDSHDYTGTVAVVTRMAVPLVADWAAVDVVESDGSFRRLTVVHDDPEKVALAQEIWRRWPATADDARGVAHVVRTGASEITAEIFHEALAGDSSDPERARAMRALGLKSSMRVPFSARGKVAGAITFGSAESGRRFSSHDLRFAEDFGRRVGAAIDNAELFRAALDARQVADEANRIKDEFLATISHELRTPLNAMLGWTRLLRSGKLAQDSERALDTIERNAVTQAQLIEDLLDVARIVSGKLRLDTQPVGITHVIEYAIDSLRLASDARKIQVVASLDPLAGSIIGDPHRLGQVLWNLLSNAIKFTPRGGRINVTLERVDSSLRILVADTGQGIAPEFLPHVFERFKQEDGKITRSHGGLGLGLAISRHIVELHGGAISAASKGEGHGTTFTVMLPVAPLRQETRGTSSRLSSSVGLLDLPQRPELVDLKILVVDDEADARELVAAVLEQMGAKVTLAGSVAEALAAVEQQLPDVLISDIGMPGEDGYVLIRKFRALANAAHIPAAALTAYARAEDRRKALDAGYMMHIPKPVEPAELISVIANLTRFAPRKPADDE